MTNTNVRQIKLEMYYIFNRKPFFINVNLNNRLNNN